MAETAIIRRTADIIELARRHAPPGTFVVDSQGPLVNDGWTNIRTGLGLAQRDKRTAALFSRSRILQQPELDALYAGDWMIARACDRPAADQTRRWVEVKVDGKKGSDDDIMTALDDLDAQAHLQEAITWARLHGGAIIVMGIADGRMPDEPVNINSIKSIDWLQVYDRWEAIPRSYYGDRRLPMYGQPEVYQMATQLLAPDGSMYGQLVHETRTLRVDGVLTSSRVRRENGGWSHGVVQRVHDQVRDFLQSVAGAAHLTTDFAQAVLKIKGLAKMMNEDKDDVIRERLLQTDLNRSLLRLIPLDEEESFERVATPISGLPELLQQLRDVVCGALDIPEKILFGKATAGLGDQGQSDLEQYYNQISGQQTRNVVPQLGRLVSYLYATTSGAPKRWSIKPCSLWEPSDTEVSENRHRDAQTDQINITTGLYSVDEARKSRFGGDGYGRDIVIEDDDEKLDAVTSAEPDDTSGPEEVKEVTGIVINAATQVIKDLIAGEITEPAARVLLRAALRLEEADISAMLEGVEEERERRKAMAEQIAAGAGAPADDEPPPPGKTPAPKQDAAREPPPGPTTPNPKESNDDDE